MAGPIDQGTHRGDRAAHGVNAWLVAILLGLMILLAVQMLSDGRPKLHDPEAGPRVVEARGDLAEDEKATIELFKQASPAVVHITSLAVRTDLSRRNVFQIPRGTGSGFVWSEDGYIVTNYHVIEGASGAAVTFSDNTTYKASLVGFEIDKDLAVLKITPEQPIEPLPLGTSADLQVGQKVFAIGNPFGLDQSLTTGIISGLGREMQSLSGRPIQDVIQTDAAINPGNSGGPLLDSAGRLIGVNTAIYSKSGDYAGIGFAVPVDTVNRIVPQLIRYGEVPHPGLGAFLLNTDVVDVNGALIFRVEPGSAAEKAGLRSSEVSPNGQITELGDVIVAIDGRPVRNSKDVFRLLDGREIGDTVVVTVLRGSSEVDVPVTLQKLNR